ncbi:hypothetical protein HPB51_022694 [Rhipicephalus microplus]|uniref:PA domain-containing protein n=1 Tax=Rhipicephalus microplus TaxID=6941 RepID=A0A9J6E411_RHIMP|nr:protease-associated domain-containing protein 1-like [Rhipicephalus microplus]KAH8029110.1 hypothetical protein HPB51_022694 [Rhipicephalus microplus]
MRGRPSPSAVVPLLASWCLLATAVAKPDSRYDLKKDIIFEITYPESLRYTFRARPALEFGTPFVNKLSHVGLVVSEPLHGCDNLINRLEIRNNVVFVQRGVCSFLTKCVEVQRNGGLAVIVAGSDLGNGFGYVEMTNDGTRRNCSIPAAFLLGRDGYMIREGLRLLGLRRAIVNVPLNFSDGTVVHRLRQPPWLDWEPEWWKVILDVLQGKY